jgi:uncharacterized protein (DUF1800 family)
MQTRWGSLLLIGAMALGLVGCNLDPASKATSTSGVAVKVTPASVTVTLGVTEQFMATVTGTTDTRLLWAVNGVAGGNTTSGTISTGGLYTPPAAVPTPSTVTVTATSMADTKVSATSAVALTKKAQGITVTVTPTGVNVMAGTTQQFSAKVSGTTNQGVTWFVDGHPGGNSLFGTISASGLYTGPSAIPNPPSIAISAISVADASKQGSADLVLRSLPIVISVSPSSVTVNLAQAQQFTATVSGTSNTAVTWTVNGTTGGSASAGTISASGLYTAPAVLPNPPSVTVAAVSVADTHFVANAETTIFNPNPLVSGAAAARFLEQASWGPTTPSVARVEQIGFNAYIDEQFATAPSSWPDLAATDGLDKMQNRFFVNAVNGQDQLRQRVAFALGEVMVISNHKIDPHGFPYYVRLLHQDAFSNYVTLLKDVTLSPAMGHYLDMVDNDKAIPSNGTSPNENYAREIMQLFSIGLMKLNPDGSLQTDASGNPIPTYTQDTIEGFASVFTGWTYPTAPGQKKQLHNPQYWTGPMESDDSDHDQNPKSLLDGTVLPAGQTAAKDLDDGLQTILNNQNVGPFICLRLIEQLVVSNPSPAYLSHCSAAFADNGSGQRGDLKAVIKAILLDSEARRGDDPTQLTQGDGKMKEPLLMMNNLLRALNATTDGANLNWYSYNMRQDLYNPPSVFNYYPPNYRLESNNLLAPEMKLNTTPSALWRANFVNGVVFWNSPGTTVVDFKPWAALASDDTKLLDALNVAFLHGAMPDQMRQTITTALDTLDPNDLNGRARTAIYLVATSQIYSVQH